jgi:NAD+ synthase
MEARMTAEELADKLTLWIKDKVDAAGCKGAVLGMSGGLDSSVVAVLCQRALPQNTLGVLMPCHSIAQDEKHAIMVADKFSIPTEKVVLDGVFDTLVGLLPDKAVDPTAGRLAVANLKVRLRMLTLYYFANQLKYLVVGSSNRSEIAIGYFTKYGDSGVDIMPLGNLVKARVRELAGFLGVPSKIIDKPPSAGLWEGQTDEEEMGISYEVLDRFLTSGEAADDLREKIEYMMAVCNHKRLPPQVPPF